MLAPRFDILYAADFQWWEHYETQWSQCEGVMRYTCNSRAANRFGAVHVPIVVKEGLSDDGLSSGNNSGHQAVSLAYLLGASEIYLIGFDMMSDESGLKHFFGDHIGGGLDNPTDDRFRRWRASMNEMIRLIRMQGVVVKNLTQDSALSI